MKRFVRIAAVAAAALAIVTIALGFAARLSIKSSTAALNYPDVASVPAAGVAIVFGAGIMSYGRPTPMLADRVLASIDLYRSGKVRRVLFSGSNPDPDDDEVDTMEQFALANGLPASAVMVDYAGLDTYDTCYRASRVFGVRRAVLVTQRFHVYRALYDCTRLGMDAVGLGTPDWGEYDGTLVARYEMRETVADVRSLWDVNVSHRPAAIMGASAHAR